MRVDSSDRDGQAVGARRTLVYLVPIACLTCGVLAVLYLSTDGTDEPLRGLLFLGALGALMVPLAAGCRRLALVRQSLMRTRRALAASRSAYRDAAEYLLAARTPARAAAGEELPPPIEDGLVDDLPTVTAAMIDALLHRDYPALAGRADGLRAAGERLSCRPLIDAAAAVADGATAADGQTATLAMMILVSTCQAIARERIVTV
ncbi:MAG: hypothetical protein GX591_02660 [Planctomycetes bacterium]|nr:hypothetical protein [Planctomycetota bacterium]